MGIRGKTQKRYYYTDQKSEIHSQINSLDDFAERARGWVNWEGGTHVMSSARVPKGKDFRNVLVKFLVSANRGLF